VANQALFLLVKNEFGLTLLDAEELVDFRMHFVANFFARLQAHHPELGVLSREYHLSEMRVLQSLLFKRSNLFSHCGSLPFVNTVYLGLMKAASVFCVLAISSSWSSASCQLELGLYSFMVPAATLVLEPRSFSNTTPSGPTINVFLVR
jgi:hypothetical protein